VVGATVILGIANRKGYEIGYYIYIEVTIARKEERDLGPACRAPERVFVHDVVTRLEREAVLAKG
jgi:hypothetical protein